MTALGLPVGSLVGMGVLGPEIVIAVGPEREEAIIAFLDRWKGTGGGYLHELPSLNKAKIRCTS
jgi:hypothetical protein